VGRKRNLRWGLFLALLLVHPVGQAQDIDKSVIETVRRHTVSIAVYYTMSEIEYNRRMDEPKSKKWSMSGNGYFWKQLVIPVKPVDVQNIATPVKCLAYIGSGTVLKNNYILSVKHLFDHGENALSMVIWVFTESGDHPISAEVVATSEGKTEVDDYALIRLKEDLKLPGLKVADKDVAKIGDQVIVTGSPGGIGFFMRFLRLTKFDWYFKTTEDGVLHLASYEDFPFWCIYPGGPGDSGGSIKNLRGEIVGILYCGIEVYSENYVFANPTVFIWDFLRKIGYEVLGK